MNGDNSKRLRINRRLVGNKKGLTLLLAFIVLVLMTAGFTFAYIVTSTGTITNTFTAAEVEVGIAEEIVDSAIDTKKDVKINNGGNISAYIRAAVVVTWQNDSGSVHAEKPTACMDVNCDHTTCGHDYAIQYNTTGWLSNGELYYWTKPVSAGDTTGVLISSCNPIGAGPEGYSLAVEIFASGIQAEGKNADEELAVENAWNVTVTGTTITAVN